MTDDFPRLRGAMTDLAEHAGSTDLYERALHTSARLRRRTVLAAAGTAAIAVTVISVGVAVAGGTPRLAPPPPAQSPTYVPSPPASPGPSSAPSPTPPSSAPPSALPSRTATRQSTTDPDTGCPTAATLERAAEMPSAHAITPDTVKCWKDWAWGWDRDLYGDGMDLFRYSRSGGWRYLGSGSAFECRALGIPKNPKDPPPFCYYEN